MRALTSLWIVLAACRPSVDDPEPAVEWSAGASAERRAEQREEDDRGWWVRYEDPALHALIERALRQSLSLRTSFTAIAQARALEDQARSARMPQINAQVGASWNRNVGLFGSTTSTAVTASLPVSYEVDLFARYAGAHHAATEDVYASELDAAGAAISTSAQVAEAWYSMVEAHARKALLAEQHQTNETYLELVRLRFEQGLASALDVHQQRQQTARSEASLALLDGELEVLRQQLAVLLGVPGAELGDLPEVATFPELGDTPDTGVPATAVWGRPDVRAAQRRVRAADWRVASAVASRLPSIRLSATPGYTWQRNEINFGGMSGPTTADGFTFNAGATLSVPLFDGFAGRGRVDQQEAILQTQIESMAQTILSSLLEVETAIVQERQQRQNVELLAQQVEIAEATLQAARDRYRTGLSDFLPVLTSLQAQQATQLQLLASQRLLVSRRIQLHRALGGAWADALEAPSPTEIREVGDDE